jgi:mannan endo-1,4-beta-mannosidase
MNISSLKKFLKKSMTVAGLCSVALPSAAVWTVQNGKILDPNGQPFIFRGITVNHMAAPDKALQAIKDAAAAGANAVQVEISANVYNQTPTITPEQLSSVIQACKDNKVVCVLEPNDVAGYPNARGTASPDQTLGFWGYQGRQALVGQQDYVIIGMGNQALADIPYGEYSARMQTYLGNYINALPGFLIMIDGSGWGQDASKEMQAFAAQNTYFARNVIYSVEMFDAYTNPEKVRDYIASFPRMGAALVIGGFAPAPYYHPYAPQPTTLVALQLPAASVMEYAEQYGTGYFAWNWSGSTYPGLNLTANWDATALTPWGELAINGVNGIKTTAKLATHFSNNSSSVSSSLSSTSSSSSSSAPNTPPTAVLTANVVYQNCGNVYGKASAEGSTDPDGDTLTYNWEITNSFSSTSIYKATGPSVQFGMEAVRTYTVKLIVTDGKGGIATVSKPLSHFYSDYCINSSSSSSFRPSSSSVAPSSSAKPSSISSSSVTPSSTSRSSSSVATKANCSYVIGSQWGNGFTAAIRVKNTGTQALNGWSVNWQYNDGSKVTGSWNATLTGSNPYNAKNLSWNANIQPGQTVEFGFQGSKPIGTAAIPVVTGSVCQ